jgi:hypothetical protein
VSALTCRDDIHEYRLEGHVVPSVTQILEPLSAHQYRYVAGQVMDDAAALGKAVHRMIELDLRDDLDTDTLPSALRMYFEAWRNFRELSGLHSMRSEYRVYSPSYNFAGTLDLAGELNGRAAIIDTKRTAAVPRTAGPQTAAYRQALHESDTQVGPVWKDADRYALHLRKDGTWRLVPFKDNNDLRVFLACAAIHSWSNQA